MKLVMTKGLPASGKSTWAKQQKAKRVNKDDLRAMIDNGAWSKQNEDLVLAVRDYIVRIALARGDDVIVDDTNLNPEHEATLRNIAEKCGAEFEIKDFTDVPLRTCIDRDSARPNKVGEAVIRKMNRQLHSNGEKAYTPPPRDPMLSDCIICDIDGTLAHMNGRNPYDETRVSEDIVDPVVKQIVEDVYLEQRDLNWDTEPRCVVFLFSGRHEGARADTEKWLTKHGIGYDQLVMRPDGDSRKDFIVKREMYDEHIAGKYNVRFILDDRDQVVKMWRKMGLKVLQVDEGDF